MTPPLGFLTEMGADVGRLLMTLAWMHAKLPVLPVSKNGVGALVELVVVVALKSEGSLFVLSESSSLAPLPGSARRSHS